MTKLYSTCNDEEKSKILDYIHKKTRIYGKADDICSSHTYAYIHEINEYFHNFPKV